MTRVIHTGDTHLGYRQYHRPERREDFLEAFRRVAEDAVELDVDAVVHAGDLFHDRRPGLSDLLGAVDVLETLANADVPFLAIVGNHEAKREAQWLDLFETMGLATRLGAVPVVLGDTAFYGLDFVPRAQREDLEYQFDPHEADHAALVAHGLFDPLVPDYGGVEWDAAEVLDASNVAFDAMLLGDEHAATRQEVDGTWVTYCGSTERASASERDARGYNLVEFDGDVRLSRRGLETREFVFIDLELAESEGFDRVRDRLREHDLEDAVVHVTLEGDGEDVSAARLEEFATEAGALVARVNDRREIEEDVDVEVAFADPDDAVRERVQSLGLSRAARDLDETIRAGGVADSNVKDEVQRRVEELVDEPEAFESTTAADRETVSDRLHGDASSDPDEEGPDEGRTDVADGTGVATADAGSTGSNPPSNDGPDEETEGSSDEDSGDDSTGEVVDATAGGAGDGAGSDVGDDTAPSEGGPAPGAGADTTSTDGSPADESPADESPADEPPAEESPNDRAGRADQADDQGQASMEDYL